MGRPDNKERKGNSHARSSCAPTGWLSIYGLRRAKTLRRRGGMTFEMEFFRTHW